MYGTRIAAAIALVVCAALPAAAQRSTHIGIGGGVNFPVGRLDSTYKAGRHGMVVLTTGSVEGPIGLRFDYSYDELRGKTVNGVHHPDTHYNALTGNIAADFHIAYLKPYVYGGGGWYVIKEAPDVKRTSTWGLNAGTGLSFPLGALPVSGFLEARYVMIKSSGPRTNHIVPVTLGLML
jgi:hypothetical protein